MSKKNTDHTASVVEDGEIDTSVVVKNTYQLDDNGAADKPSKFTRKRMITLPSYSFKKRNRGFFKVLGEMKISDVVVKGKLDADGKEIVQRPPIVMQIMDLETNRPAMMIVPAVLAEQLKKEGDYVGKSYEVETSKREDKAYKDVTLYEI